VLKSNKSPVPRVVKEKAYMPRANWANSERHRMGIYVHRRGYTYIGGLYTYIGGDIRTIHRRVVYVHRRGYTYIGGDIRT
jgi:hypothetical protein